MTDTFDTGRKNHCRGAKQCHILSVLPCAGCHSAAPEVSLSRILFHQFYNAFVEQDRLESGQAFCGNLHAVCFFKLHKIVRQGFFLRLQSSFIRIPNIHGEDSFGWNHIDGIGFKCNTSRRRDSFSIGLQAPFTHKSDDLCRRNAGIVPVGDGRSTGVVLSALNGDLLPGDTLQILHSTDVVTFCVQNRSLFNVEFYKGVGL